MSEQRSKVTDVVLGILITICLSLSGWTGRSLMVQGENQAAMRQQILSLSEEVRDIKLIGSPSLQAALKSLQAEVEARREADLALSKRVEDSRADFSQRCANITSLLERQVEQQTALISLIRAQNQMKQ